jgi:DNA-binding transcriptional MerR regulator
MALNVSQVARQVGISADAVRFYEREGLLPPPSRSPAGYREYDPSIAHRIRFIKGAQAMGLKLAEIKELLEIQDRGLVPAVTPATWSSAGSQRSTPRWTA